MPTTLQPLLEQEPSPKPYIAHDGRSGQPWFLLPVPSRRMVRDPSSWNGAGLLTHSLPNVTWHRFPYKFYKPCPLVDLLILAFYFLIGSPSQSRLVQNQGSFCGHGLHQHRRCGHGMGCLWSSSGEVAFWWRPTFSQPSQSRHINLC